jgi:hypothetical protein
MCVQQMVRSQVWAAAAPLLLTQLTCRTAAGVASARTIHGVPPVAQQKGLHHHRRLQGGKPALGPASDPLASALLRQRAALGALAGRLLAKEPCGKECCCLLLADHVDEVPQFEAGVGRVPKVSILPEPQLRQRYVGVCSAQPTAAASGGLAMEPWF